MLPYLHVFHWRIPMYGLMMAIGFLIALLVSYLRVKKNGLDSNDMLIMIASTFLFALVGGQILYDITAYSWSQIVQFIREGRLEMLVGSGLVFYGGLLGGLFGAFVACRLLKVCLWDYLYAAVPAVPLAHMFGRIGCFCGGCCYGCETTLPIGVIYTTPLTDAPIGVPLLPVQLIEAGLNLLLFVFLILYDRKTRGKRPRLTLICLYAMCYAVIRFTLEFFRYDAIRGIYFGVSTSQWISIALFIAFTVLLVVSNRKAKQQLKTE